MAWSPEHRERTHEKIVAVASRLFRKRGYGGAGVDTVMAAAGLTRGGFYAHFRDKAALFSETLERSFDDSEANLFGGRLAELRGDAWIEAASERYLAMRHRDAPEAGCPVPALGAEVARAPRGVRRTFAARAERIVSRMAERIGGRDARARAIALLAQWTGALVLARAVEDRALAQEILDAARR